MYSPPLSDDQLQQIRERVEQVRGKTFLAIASLEGSSKLAESNQTRADREALLAEVDRLRAREAALTQEVQEGAAALLRTHRILSQKVAQNAALAAVLQEMTEYTRFSNAAYPELWQRARALLASEASGAEREKPVVEKSEHTPLTVDPDDYPVY